MNNIELIALMAAVIYSGNNSTTASAAAKSLTIYRHVLDLKEEIEHESQKHNRA